VDTREGSIPQRTIRRDPAKHAWVLIGGAADDHALPWSDQAPAVNVVLWLRSQMNGRVNVTVEL
jgi:hypothetical protein